jgi:molybdopterin synthase sulfur carrier subunit
MIRIKVKFFGPFRDVFGGRELELDLPADARLRELLRRVGDTPDREKQIFAGAGVLHPHVVIMKNGTLVHGRDGLDSSLQNGDIIAIFPFLGGG